MQISFTLRMVHYLVFGLPYSNRQAFATTSESWTKTWFPISWLTFIEFCLYLPSNVVGENWHILLIVCLGKAVKRDELPEPEHTVDLSRINASHAVAQRSLRAAPSPHNQQEKSSSVHTILAVHFMKASL